MKNIYLDASATTPPHIDVINKLKDIQSECWGNPSSIHKVGVFAREILERSRLSIANKLKASSEEIFSHLEQQSQIIFLLKLYLIILIKEDLL